jgi:putative cell wall-binding protein
MKSPSRVVSIWTLLSLIAHTLLMAVVSPSPAYAITLDDARAASGRIGAGESHSVARTAGSIAIAWGNNSDNQTALSGMDDVTKVAAGASHSLALKSDGTVVAFGLDSYGQCQVPPGLTGVIAVAAGEDHSLALRSNGTVVAWGANTFGQSTVPAGLAGVTAIAAGSFHSLALKSDGTVVAWGANGSGQSTVPATLTNVVAIAGGGFHSLALRSNGTVTGWGDNSEGQRIPPTGLSGVVTVAAGWRHSLALKSDGTVAAWGGGGVEPSIAVPAGLNNVIAISAGWRHSLALRSNGTPVGWGLNSSGQCFGPVSIDPAPNSRDLPTDTVFRIAYSAPIKAGGAYSQVRLEDSQGSPVAISKTINGTGLTVTPSAALLTDERYVLQVPAGSLVDDYGNSSPGATYYYDTLDTVPPTVVSVRPVDGAQDASVRRAISVEFSERVALGPSIGSVTLVSGSGHTVACAYSTLLELLVIAPLETLEPETSYTLTVPAAAVTDLSGNPLAAQFTSSFTTGKTRTISATAGVGGSISPAGEVIVDEGADQSFTIAPDIGYEFDTVLVDGAPATLTDETYTFTDVTGDHTISVTFALKTYTLSYSAGTGGTISGSTPQTVGHGGAGTPVTAVPDDGYLFVKWSDDVMTASRTDTNVTADKTVTAAFALLQPPPASIPIEGLSRFHTAVAASQEAYPDGSQYVIIATGRNWPDALGGAALAGVLDAPILLSEPTSLPTVTADEISRLGATHAIILGGTGAVSSGVQTTLATTMGLSVERIDGLTRYQTADKIALRVIELQPGYGGTAFVATGADFPDALAAAPLAAANGWPLYLAHPTTGLSDATKAAMTRVTRVRVLGGTGAVSPATYSYLSTRFGAGNVARLAGDTRYSTAVAIASWGVSDAGLGWDRVGIATGQDYPDALAGGVLQGKVGSVMLLTLPTTLHASTATALRQRRCHPHRDLLRRNRGGEQLRAHGCA